MSQDKLQRLRTLEVSVEKLKEARVRASERLALLRKQRDEYIKELKGLGVSPTKVKEQLTKLADLIEVAINDIEKQIPPNLAELLNEENSGNGEEV